MFTSKLKNTGSIALSLALLGLSSCNEAMLGEEPANTPTSSFEVLWSEFDQNYSLFELKNLDWQAVYDDFAPRVTDQLTDDQLFDLFSEMLDELNDGHVWIVKPNPGFRRYDSGPKYPEGTFSLDLIRDELSEEKVFGPTEEPIILYGKFKNTNIGYLYLDHLGETPGFYEDQMKSAIAYLSSTDELILDARGIEGGDDRSAQVVAGFFAEDRELYMKTRFKNGPDHGDFGDWISWYVNPANSAFLKPVVVLTDRGTGSAGETFTLAMRKSEKVTIVGNFTYGAFSDNPKKELPNGWIVAMSTGDFRDDAGISYEGIGLEPDQLVVNTPEQVANGMDRAILAGFGVLLGN